MTDSELQNARLRGQAIRAARAARVRLIRRRVIGAALGLFLAAWLLIAVVLVTGHDPALSRQVSTVAAVSNSNSGTGSSGTSSGSSASSGTVSSVSTHQS